jgi:hypothetical protein
MRPKFFFGKFKRRSQRERLRLKFSEIKLLALPFGTLVVNVRGCTVLCEQPGTLGCGWFRPVLGERSGEREKELYVPDISPLPRRRSPGEDPARILVVILKFANMSSFIL